MIDIEQVIKDLHAYSLKTKSLMDAIKVLEVVKDSKPNEQLTAKWKINPDGYYPYCSNCGDEAECRAMTAYCPCCGAEMTNGFSKRYSNSTAYKEVNDEQVKEILKQMNSTSSTYSPGSIQLYNMI